MTKHIFLTGRKQIGKSTVIRRFLSASGAFPEDGCPRTDSCPPRTLWSDACRIHGFLTIRSTEVFPDSTSVHLIPAGDYYAQFEAKPLTVRWPHMQVHAGMTCAFDLIAQKKKPSKENFLFFCGKDPRKAYQKYPQILTSPGANHLASSDAAIFPCPDPGLLISDTANHSETNLPAVSTIRQDTIRRFNLLGCAALSPIPEDTSLILMDEIGPHESDATDFANTVCRCLDDTVSVLGVLQNAPSTLSDRIRRHPDVTILQVTEENRDTLPGLLLRNYMQKAW